MNPALIVVACLLLLGPAGQVSARVNVTRLDAMALPGSIEVRGVGAGSFDPELWRGGGLNLLQDVRSPLLEPLEGKCRNIYAPSVVEVPDGWRVFFGAWDGVSTCNDRIYSVTTKDFIEFDERHTVIDNGPFIHVCNVNAIALPDRSFSMVCTAYPNEENLNKPAIFHSPDGHKWNGMSPPCVPSRSNVVEMEGYDKYDAADINGMNVILFEDGRYRLYFGNFRDFGKVQRASSSDGKVFRFEKEVLQGSYAVNDVKKFRVGGDSWYLMGLHMNTDTLWYSLSKDGQAFPPVSVLGKNLSVLDRYIVAHGWVVSGEQEKQDRRLLGYLYGAGPDPGLAQNRIWARWLQKKAAFIADDGRRLEGVRAHGPERQLLEHVETDPLRGRFEVYSEDASTLLGRSDPVTIRTGEVWQIELEN